MTTIIRRRKLGRTSCREIAKNMQTPCKVLRSDRRAFEDDLYIRWGCTTNVPCKNVLNTSEAIHRVNDKKAFRMLLDKHGLCPKTYSYWLHVPMNIEGNCEVLTDGPVVLRPQRHAQGKHTYLCKTPEDLEEHVRVSLRDGDHYVSKFIPKVAEYRVFVVSGRAACVAEKTPSNPDDVAWNVAKGGRFDVTPWKQWPLRAVKTAIEAFKLSGLDFGGVDVMVDAQGKPYVLEINSAPSLTSPYRQQCMAKCFDYIVEHGKAIIPLIEAKGGYSKFIHPAVCEEAKLVGDE